MRTAVLLPLLCMTVFSKLTLHQAMTLDTDSMDCDDLEEINVAIADIKEWIEVIDERHSLLEDIEGLQEIQKMVKQSKSAAAKLHQGPSFIQLIDRISRPTAFDTNLASILRLMEEMQRSSDLARKKELLNEVEVCVQATLFKFQALAKQSQSVKSSLPLQEKLNLLDRLQEECYVPQEDFEQKNKGRSKHHHHVRQTSEDHHTKRHSPQKFVKKKDLISNDMNDQLRDIVQAGDMEGFNQQDQGNDFDELNFQDEQYQQDGNPQGYNGDDQQYDELDFQDEADQLDDGYQTVDIDQLLESDDQNGQFDDEAQIEDLQGQEADGQETLGTEQQEQVDQGTADGNEQQQQVVEEEQQVVEQHVVDANDDQYADEQYYIDQENFDEALQQDEQYQDENQAVEQDQQDEAQDQYADEQQVDEQYQADELQQFDEASQVLENKATLDAAEQAIPEEATEVDQQVADQSRDTQYADEIDQQVNDIQEKNPNAEFEGDNNDTQQEAQADTQISGDVKNFNKIQQEIFQGEDQNQDYSAWNREYRDIDSFDNPPEWAKKEQNEEQHYATQIIDGVKQEYGVDEISFDLTDSNNQQSEPQNQTTAAIPQQQQEANTNSWSNEWSQPQPKQPQQAQQQQQQPQQQQQQPQQPQQSQQQSQQVPQQQSQPADPISQTSRPPQTQAQGNSATDQYRPLPDSHTSQSARQDYQPQPDNQLVKPIIYDRKPETNNEEGTLSFNLTDQQGGSQQLPNQNLPPQNNLKQVGQDGSGDQSYQNWKEEKPKKQFKLVADPEKLIDPSKFVPYKHKPIQRTDGVSYRQSKFYDSEELGKGVYDEDYENKELQDAEEYGYGYWMRAQGLMNREQYYFLSRMTTNKEFLDFQNYGDRTLSSWIFNTAFVFATYDYSSRIKNKFAQINLNEDITSRWYFLSFSYSSKKQLAVGIILAYGGGKQLMKIDIPATHAPPMWLRFMVGGKHMHYHGLQGQFANIFCDIDAPAFIETEEQLKKCIGEVSFPPASLSSYTETQVLGAPQTFDANKNNGEIRSFSEQLIYRQYAFSGWFRWQDNLIVKEPNSFQLLNLRISPQRTQLLGDRTLEIHFVYGGGAQNTAVSFQTYSVEGNSAKGQERITKSVKYDQHIWTYVYFGYDANLRLAYGLLIKPGQNQELSFEGVEHKQVNSLFITVGGDRSVASFNGRIAYVGAYFGPDAFTKEKKAEYRYLYGEGATQLYQLVKPLIFRGENPLYDAAFDAPKALINQFLVQDDDKIRINGQSEYSYAFWSCWLTSYPKYLPKREPLHQIARMGTQSKPLEIVDKQVKSVNEGSSSIRDVTLLSTLGKDEYEFSSYNMVDGQIRKCIIPFKDKLEGSWNYIHFGYKKVNLELGMAKAYVQFGYEGEVQECSFETLHYYLTEFLEFFVGKATLPLFNGKLAHIQMRVGSEAFLVTQEEFKNWQKIEKPPQQIIERSVKKTQRETIDLLTGEKNIPQLSEEANTFQFDFTGGKEYALSGWVKWYATKNSGGLTNVVLMIQKKVQDIRIGSFDASLGVQRADTEFIFSSYNCALEDCSKIEEAKIELGEYWDQWTYIYIGYSDVQKKLFGYSKFTFQEQKIVIDKLNRVFLSSFSIFLGKKYGVAGTFAGLMKSWVLNVGEGSYKEGGFNEGEQINLNFGFDSGSEHLKRQSTGRELDFANKLIDSMADDRSSSWKTELSTEQVNGITSYGYGYWSRFRFYGKSTLYAQPKLLAMSRLTSNKNFQDQSNPGDRVLAVMLGLQTYEFSSYNGKVPFVAGTIRYKVEWESEWVFVYFSYKRISQTSGQAVGYIAKGNLIEEIKLDVVHFPLNDYLLLTIGDGSPSYPNFNGQFKGIRLRLGDHAFVNTKEAIQLKIKNTDPEPQLKYDTYHKYTLVEGKVEQTIKIERNPAYIDFPSNQYSVAMWFRQSQQPSSNQEIIFRLTSNKVPTNQAKIGDRVFSLIKQRANLVELSTYSIHKPEEQVAIPFNCQIPDIISRVWSFVYMGYSKPLQKLYYYLKADEFECKGEEQILHAISDQLWMYIASDSLLQRFEGAVAQVALSIGPDSFTSTKVHYLPEYLVAESLFPKSKKSVWEKNDLFALAANQDSQSSTLKVEFYHGYQYPIEQLSEYSFGLWMRHLTAIPVRQFKKPPIMQIARLGENHDTTEGMIKVGDRALAAHMVFEYFQFSTYDLNTQETVQQKFLKYDFLEGVWRYVYMGYSKAAQIMNAFTFDTQVLGISIDKILHKPIADYMVFILGKEEQQKLEAVQGQYTKLIIQIGPGSFIGSSEEFKKLVDSSYQLPYALTQEFADKQKSGKFEVIGDKLHIDQQGGVTLEGEKWAGVSEYSIAGWFKSQIDIPVDDNFCQILFRLTNNPREVLNDRKSQGDRTLFAQLCGGNIVKMSTYTLIGIKDPNESNMIESSVDLLDFKSSWIFIYMGYNYRTREVQILVKTLNQEYPVQLENIQHFVPNYLGLTIGIDKFVPKFKGLMQKWSTMYGYGAFVSLKRPGYQELLPFFGFVKSNIQNNWVSQYDTIISTPQQIIQEFTTQMEQLTEYSFGLWTRWLTDFPDDLGVRKDSYSIFRLTSNRDHTDKQRFGDRVLSVFLTPQAFEFSTYDLTTSNFALSAQAKYELLEGMWNYVYMAFKDGEAVGIVITRDTSKAQRVSFKARHFPLSGYAKLLINVAEYGHSQFHGWYFDPRLYLGAGAFISDSQKLVMFVQKIHRKIPNPETDLPDWKWDTSVIDTTSQELNSKYLFYKFDQQQEAIEYAHCMWIQQAPLLPGMPETQRLVARLTTTEPQNLKDNQYAGDRTLLNTIQNEKLFFYTYYLQDPPKYDPIVEQLTIDPLQWTFVYFGYRRGEALAYQLQVKGPSSKQLKANHIVPNIFYLYLIKDQAFPVFYGKMSDVKVYFGSSSYFTDPKVAIDRWPFDKKFVTENKLVMNQVRTKRTEESQVEEE